MWEGQPQRAARTAHHLGVFRRGKGTPKGAGHCGSRVEVGAGAVGQRAGGSVGLWRRALRRGNEWRGGVERAMCTPRRQSRGVDGMIGL